MNHLDDQEIEQCPNFKKLMKQISKTRKYYIGQGFNNEQINEIILQKMISPDFSDGNLFNKLSYTSDYYMLQSKYHLENEEIEQTMHLRKALSKINKKKRDISEVSDLLKYRLNGVNSISPSTSNNSNSEEGSGENDNFKMNNLINNEIFHDWTQQHSSNSSADQSMIQNKKRKMQQQYSDDDSGLIDDKNHKKVKKEKSEQNPLKPKSCGHKRRFPSFKGTQLINNQQEKKLKLYQSFNNKQ